MAIVNSWLSGTILVIWSLMEQLHSIKNYCCCFSPHNKTKNICLYKNGF